MFIAKVQSAVVAFIGAVIITAVFVGATVGPVVSLA